jgi:plasmid stabilization system protein ParE
MASCTVWVAASADAAVQRISRWWAKNRPAAPRLFELELARAIEMIEAHPEIGRWARAHVVQQSQSRVSATAQAKGVGLNDDSSLEREANEMVRGPRAANRPGSTRAAGHRPAVAWCSATSSRRSRARTGESPTTSTWPALVPPLSRIVTVKGVRSDPV